jgi:putative peptide zinc metalloprotease protein
MPSRLITILIAVVVTALSAPAAAAQDNRADAVNTEDEALVFELAFDLHRTMDDVVDETNTAVAYASCERCRTIAIAFQIVLAMDAAAVVVPVNVAVAVNNECTACETLAFAYQLVLSGDQRVRLTGEGRARIRRIRRALRALRHSDAPLDQIVAELQRRTVELQDVLRTELVPVGRREAGDTASLEAASDPTPQDSAEASPDPAGAAPNPSEAPSAAGEPPAETVEAPSEAVEPPPAAPEESPAPTAEPTPTATPEPTPEPTAPTPEPTPEPTPTATPTPTPSIEPAP